MVRGIGEALGLEAEPVALAIGPARGADQGAVQAIGGIELQPRRIGQHLEDAPGHRLMGARRQPGTPPSGPRSTQLWS